MTASTVDMHANSSGVIDIAVAGEVGTVAGFTIACNNCRGQRTGSRIDQASVYVMTDLTGIVQFVVSRINRDCCCSAGSHGVAARTIGCDRYSCCVINIGVGIEIGSVASCTIARQHG